MARAQVLVGIGIEIWDKGVRYLDVLIGETGDYFRRYEDQGNGWEELIEEAATYLKESGIGAGEYVLENDTKRHYWNSRLVPIKVDSVDCRSASIINFGILCKLLGVKGSSEAS